MGEHTFDEEADGPVGLVDGYRSCSSDELAATYVELGGAVRAIEAQRLALLALLDEREAWRVDGARDAAGWVAATDAVRRRTGRARVEVARKLAQLPAVAALAAAGGLSFEQLVPICELADPADPASDERWAHDGPGLGPAELDARAARARRVTRDEAERQRGVRTVSIWKAQGGGSRIAGYLPDVDVATLTAGLDRIAGRYGQGSGQGFVPLGQRRADALVELATASLSATTWGAPGHVYVHADAGLLGRDGDGWAVLPDGTPIAREVLERIGCDATVQLVLHDESGAVVGLGSPRRTVPRRIRRLLAQRDRTCRFPGCEMVLGVHAHHIRFWSRGGPTATSNLVLLCHRHHTLVHEGGWRLQGDPTDPLGLTFTGPDGRCVSGRPAPCTTRVRERLVPPPPRPRRPAPPARPAVATGAGPCGWRVARLEAVRNRIHAQALRALLDDLP